MLPAAPGAVLRLHRKEKQRSSGLNRPRPQSRLLSSPQERELETGIGTHYAYLWVGTPPQRQSVIIDTGSYRTAFPCSPCSDCGDYKSYHEGSPFEPTESSTARFTGGRWNQQYGEGDGWSAAVLEDECFIGDEDFSTVAGAEQDRSVLELGCQDSISGLFVTQKADGIMGLSNSDDAIVPRLFKAGAIPADSFSLCLALEGGTLSLSGMASHLHVGDVQFAATGNHGVFYGVTLLDILVLPSGSVDKQTGSYSEDDATIQAASVKAAGGNGAAAAFGGNGDAILDSGTTFTYLPNALKAGFATRWQALTGFEYDTEHALSAAQSDPTRLPDLVFVLRATSGGGSSEEPSEVRVLVRPRGYIDHYCPGGDYGTQCFDYPSIVFEGSTFLLGANVLQDHDVFFDRANKRVGFAAVTDCAFSAWPTPQPSLTPQPTVTPLPSPLPTPGPVPESLSLGAVVTLWLTGSLVGIALCVWLGGKLMVGVKAFRTRKAAVRSMRQSGVTCADPSEGFSGSLWAAAAAIEDSAVALSRCLFSGASGGTVAPSGSSSGQRRLQRRRGFEVLEENNDMRRDRMESDDIVDRCNDVDDDGGDVVEFSGLELPSFGTNTHQGPVYNGSSQVDGARDECNPMRASSDGFESSDEELDATTAENWREEDPIAAMLSDARARGCSETRHDPNSPQIDVL